MDFEVLIPDGYEVVETDQVVESESVFTHFFALSAIRHAEQLNAARVGPLLRYEVERASREMRRILGWGNRWVVVPYQNVLRKVSDK